MEELEKRFYVFPQVEIDIDDFDYEGYILDIGGALAHGSIVAREYGIPAVMGTGAATQRIENGQLIRVDGDNGTVALLDKVDTRK